MILSKQKTNRTRDFLLLAIIFTAVSLSLPVSTMGYQSAFDYFFSEKDIQLPEVDSDCLLINKSCTISLGDKNSMVVKMPTEVSSIESFNISVDFNGKKIDGVSILFKGVEHAHSLKKILMSEVTPNQFSARGQLGYCGSGLMHWTAVLDVYADHTIYKVSLPFISIDPKANTKEAIEWLKKQS